MARRERCIYRRKDGRFEARYIKGRGADGKAVYGSVYDRNYAKVKDKLEHAKAAAKPNTSGSKQSIVAVLISHLEAVRVQIKPSSHGMYQGYIDNHISRYFGTMRCDRLSQAETQGFINQMTENGLSATTVQSVFSFARKGLEGAVSADVLAVKLPKRVENQIEILSMAEQKRLESAAKTSDDINRIGIIICLYSGIRVGELCGLMWKDLDFERGLLHIRRTMQRVKNTGSNSKTSITFLTPKSNSSMRSIPLPGFLLELLKEHQAISAGDYIISRKGKPVEPRNMQYRFKILLEKAGIRPCNFHITRHIFATRALECGFDVKTLSEILGHASPSITLKIYAHTLDEHKRKSMESLLAIYEHGQKHGRERE